MTVHLLFHPDALTRQLLPPLVSEKESEMTNTNANGIALIID